MEMTPTHLTITEHTRRQRREMSLAGKILWQRLRGNRIAGQKFKRQHPISGYIVDFACVQHRLVVELDTGARPTGEALQRERRRMLDLMHEDWTVLRLGEADVLDRLEQVIATITRHLAPPPDRQAVSAQSTPTASREHV